MANASDKDQYMEISHLKKIPTKLKELLETGLLEGISVRYQYGVKKEGKSGGLKGKISGTGIVCSCSSCQGDKVVSPNEFEVHAHSNNKRSADYIFLENGNNLRDVLKACKNASLEALESVIKSMIVCASSSTEQNIFCPNCKGSVTGGGGEEMLLCSCVTRCALCRGHDFSASRFGPRTIIICDQCEKEYHVSCLKEHEMDDLKELPEEKWFCCKDCSGIHLALEERVAMGEDFLPDSLLDVLKKNLGDDEICSSWRLLSGRSAYKANEAYKMLSEAVSIFQVSDSNSGVGDLIPHMVFGREVGDQDFGGMYCAVLKVNLKIVAAGIIRVFGEGMAELPLVATRTETQNTSVETQKTITEIRRQVYFQVLLSRLENLLQSLNVKKLVMPAADKAECRWINTPGFSKISKQELMSYQKDYQLMLFQRKTMLQKSIGSS